VPLGEGFLVSPRTRASKRGTPLKTRYSAAISSYSVKMVADGSDLLHIVTSTGDGLFRFVNLDDLE